MRADTIVQSQLQIAQAISALAKHMEGATGYALTPVSSAQLPRSPTLGMIACITDSTVNHWGGNIAVGGGVSGGPYTVLGFYNGTHWTVMAT